jgi:hypothetical protein
MPALRSVTFNPNLLLLDMEDTLETLYRRFLIISFLKIHGARLQELALACPNSFDLNSLCPNLVTLNLTGAIRSAGGQILISGIPPHRTISHVGLTGLKRTEDVAQEDPHGWCASLLEAYPSVKIIQDISWDLSTIKSGSAFCGSRSLPLRQRRPIWEGILPLMVERDILILDWTGLPLGRQDS